MRQTACLCGLIHLVHSDSFRIPSHHAILACHAATNGAREHHREAGQPLPEEIAAFERHLVKAQRAAYLETMIEDDEIAERMDAGRQRLHQRGVSDTGPYQSPLEDGMRHFHAWYRRALSSPAACALRVVVA
jgi:phenylpropionate dioxygenase-like ring-hydroxylating dioxygenase large terminal subunit